MYDPKNVNSGPTFETHNKPGRKPVLDIEALLNVEALKVRIAPAFLGVGGFMAAGSGNIVVTEDVDKNSPKLIF